MKIDYDQSAQPYARFRKIYPRTFERLLQIGDLEAQSRVLEVGCGTGNYIAALSELTGCEGHGLEPSAGMRAQAQARTQTVVWTQGNAHTLPYPDATFDFLFCVDVIHHVTQPARFLSEAFRVLKPGGRLAIATDSEWTIRHRNPLSVYFPETIEKELQRYLPFDRLKALVVETGFADVADEISEHPYLLETADALRTKAFSCLHLIPESAFQRGLAKLTRVLEQGPLPCIERHALLHAAKP